MIILFFLCERLNFKFQIGFLTTKTIQIRSEKCQARSNVKGTVLFASNWLPTSNFVEHAKRELTVLRSARNKTGRIWGKITKFGKKVYFYSFDKIWYSVLFFLSNFLKLIDLPLKNNRLLDHHNKFLLYFDISLC